jgi:plasmid stabilization system protein ParE
MVADIRVIPTRNFERNLDAIGNFLAQQEQQQLFDALLDHLFNEVIPNLASFPLIGRDFLQRKPESLEALQLCKRISEAGGARSIREYLFDPYLMLYSVDGQQLHLLPIKHHRQLSFDFPSV